ncbi:GatB/YqeY domain-containing protein [Candidatus Falkowbacteria bacterium]|nr:GatB/YqeY domain-containing protein [Candidatus Falkowbacteria bacterium]
MTLKEKIEQDFVAARKAKNEVVVSTLGMLKSAVTNAEIAGMRKGFTDEDVLKVIASEIKKHKDSIAEYEKGRRADLASKEKVEMEILAKYMPTELSEEELKKIVEEKIKEFGAASPADFGKVMGAVMKAAGGRAGGDAVSKMVKEILEKE